MFGSVKWLKALLFILMTCVLLSGNRVFADVMPCSTQVSHAISLSDHAAIDQTTLNNDHCSPKQMNTPGSLHIEDCSSSHCPQCFSLIPSMETTIQPDTQHTANTPFVAHWLLNTYSPELRPPILL